MADATLMKDNSHVILKRIERTDDALPDEVQIMQYLTSRPLSSERDNHCVPLLAVLEPPSVPSQVILVMPVLRPYDDPDFETIGEGLECLRQILKVMHGGYPFIDALNGLML